MAAIPKLISAMRRVASAAVEGDGRRAEVGMAMNEDGVVLVVDDDASWREVVVQLLALEGVTAATASNGLEALRALRRGRTRPDAIVLDLSMPLLSGWQFRDEQLRDPSLRDIPVVVVSGDELGRTRADRYLRKPCSPDELLGALRSLAPLRCAA
jgi:CheY-like chemotaxis protein